MNTKEPIIRMENIVKVFPNVVANDGINFEIYPNEVHALLGENGAGKTTLMNILYGLYKPDSGNIYIYGKKVNIKNPLYAQKFGIGMVHQHFSLIPYFNVLENISIGLNELKINLNLEKVKKKLEEIMKKYGLLVDPEKRIEEMSVGEMQRVEILKLLFRGANVLILDEPTSALTPQEVDELFRSIRDLVKEGKSVVIITHKLYEVFQISDRITVLRKGKVTYKGLTSETTQEALVEAMIGKSVSFNDFSREQIKVEGSLRVEGLTLYGKGNVPIIKDVTFELKRGEILGIAAVAGNGEKELIDIIFGLIKQNSGKIILDGKEIQNKPVKNRIEMGLSFIPAERLTRGVAAGLALYYNSILHDHWSEPYIKHSIINEQEMRNFARKIIKSFEVVAKSEEVLAKQLSGGNLQKFIVGREMLRSSKYILAVNPTSGLDVSATQMVRQALVNMRNSGVGILLSSEDLDELVSVSDRIIVMYKGQIVGSFERHEFDKIKIGALMLGKNA